MKKKKQKQLKAFICTVEASNCDITRDLKYRGSEVFKMADKSTCRDFRKTIEHILIEPEVQTK